jgi:hypothetical protein
MADEPRLEDLARTTSAGLPYGLTDEGFLPKPMTRLIEEKLAATRALFGDDIDLTSGAALRTICEVVALEEARLWTHLALCHDATSVRTATGAALSSLGAELGLPRPHERAHGRVTFAVAGAFPPDVPEVRLARGTRLLTPGGHDFVLDAEVVLSATVKEVEAPVRAFAPGPTMNLDPSVLDGGGVAVQALDRFHPADGRSLAARQLAADAGADVITIRHTVPFTGGELWWDDERYRDLLLAYPRNVWTPEAVRLTVALVPGVRQVVVRDQYGGLDLNQSIFGNFSFIERLFSEERSLGDPSFFAVLVAPDDGALWDGPGELEESVRTAVDAIRPVGVHARIEPATEIGVGFTCQVRVEGLPIPSGTPASVDATPEALALKARIIDRVRRYTGGLLIGEPVRASEVVWALMEEPGVVDATAVRLVRRPGLLADVDLVGDPTAAAEDLEAEEDVPIGPAEVASLVDDLVTIRIV